jgi:putative ABC transport system ATP-binding protein
VGSNSLLQVEGLKRLHLGPVNISLSAGECITVTGPSGAGKSLLLRAIADLDAHEGLLYIDGKSSLLFRGHEWRQQVALLPAEPAWWGDTIGEHFRTHGTGALTALGFADSVLGWSVARCSTGERQRLALLRLLENHPRVLLLDEPTAGLDRKNTLQVESLVKGYCNREAAAVIWVSHDPEQIERLGCRQLTIENGVVQSVGLAS